MENFSIADEIYLSIYGIIFLPKDWIGSKLFDAT